MEATDMSLGAGSAFLRAAGLEITASSAIEVRGRIEIGPEHHQPWGIVHGGVDAAAIETACSVGAYLRVEPEGRLVVGVGNHTEFLRAHREGPLDVHAHAVHQGRTGQLRQCDVTRADGALVARGQVRLQHVDAR